MILEDEASKQWWRGLSKAEQMELRDQSRFDRSVIRLQGWAVDPQDVEDDERMTQQFYDYVVAHDLVELMMDPVPFHICRAHSAARALIRNGRIPAGFRCPLQRADCPMRVLLAQHPGKDVRVAK